MYKVFFKDRTVFFGSDFSSSFRNNNGLFYKYRNRGELKELIDAFFRLEKINQLFLFHNDVEVLKKQFVSCFKMVKASGGLVKRNSHEFLFIKRNGLWDLPKGKNEDGETSEATALREVSEECGLSRLTIEGEVTKTYHTYIQHSKPILKETTWFEMTSLDEHEPVPQENENITMATWMESGEIGSVTNNTYLSIIEVLKAKNLL